MADPCGCPEEREKTFVATEAVVFMFLHLVLNEGRGLKAAAVWNSPHILTALRDRERVCRMSSIVFKTRPLQSRWGNLVEVKKMRNGIQTVFDMVGKEAHSRLSQTRKVLVRHSADPLVDVVEVDQQELSVALQLLLVGLGFGLKMIRRRRDI